MHCWVALSEQYSRLGFLVWYLHYGVKCVCCSMPCKKYIIKSQTTVVLWPCTENSWSVGCIVICSNVIGLLWLVVSLCSWEVVEYKALIKFWLQSHTPWTEPPPSFESWISDYFYATLKWVLSARNQVVDTTVTGLVGNDLTHLH